MPHPFSRRLSGITGRFFRLRLLLALLCAATVFSGSVNGASADDGKQQVNLSLKPMDQPGSYFSLNMGPGQNRQLKVELGNHGAAAIAARTYAADGYTLINGGFGAKDRDSTATGATSWLTYPSEVLQLPAGQASVRTFTLTVPAGAAPGDYVSGLVLENDRPIQGAGSVALNQIVRQVVAVSIHVSGPLQAALSLGTASHKLTGGNSVVAVQIKNTGTTNLKPAGPLRISDHDGKTVSEAAVSLDTVFARTDTQSETTLNGKLQPGNYTAIMTLTDPATQTTTTGTIPFTVADQNLANSGTTGQGPLPQIIQDAGTGPWPWIGALSILVVLAAVLFLRTRRRTTGAKPDAAGSSTARHIRRGN
jgi:hypothetical protein